ncbi:AAA family ATPase [Mycobacterium hodleri]|uniref:AAA family ATPase n=2 Tax=Mycolicibacterium hodleri TaxID=49897 RepID=A0A544W0K2_9MYCO|nr:AAA family ATPase [Mycolicibacterium hodleri]
MRLWRNGVELDAGPRQQACLLALLLAQEGRPISTAEIIDVIWGEGAPASAVNVLHKYIGALRRLVEPTLPARSAGSYLLRRGTGYLFTAGPGELDLVSFREYLTAAESALSEHRRGEALDSYVAALQLWAGPAGDGLAHGPAAMSIFAGLNDEFFDACTAATELALSQNRPERVLAPLQLAAAMAPLHEPVQASLVGALGAAGRQVEALSVFRRVRTRLADDLGLDPGHALESAHRRVLSQSATQGRPTPPPEELVAEGLVGRAEELAVLWEAVDAASTGGGGLVIMEGEPGVGKTRLLQEVAGAAGRRDGRVAWGSCLDGDGTPSMWPWIQVVGAVVHLLPTALQQKWLDGDLGRLLEPRDVVLGGSVLTDTGAQFRLFERVVAVVAEVSAERPLVIVIDDLHWADVASLQLFTHLTAQLPGGAVVIGALRDHAPAPGTEPELARMLATASRVPGHRRVVLGPLTLAEVTELIRRETGQDPAGGAARDIFARTAGNPFFVRELSRFLAAGGSLSTTAATQKGVPSTVRDVVRDRVADLDDGVIRLLHIAALIGRDVALSLLARVAGIEIQSCLDRLEPLHGLGLLEPTPQDPYSFRFTHDLVRESVAGITPPGRATQLHMGIADALESTDSDDDTIAERLAYHLWAAGPLADPARTAGALARAGGRAATKSALEAAERQLRLAVQVAHQAGLAELELSSLSQLTAVVGMRSMYGTAALDLLERAEYLARGLGRELEAAGFLFSRWTAHQQAIELDRAGPLARRLLEQGYASTDLMVRTYGLQAWGLHQWDVGNIGESFRYLSQSEQPLLDGLARREEDPVRGDLELLMIGMLAEVTALHGDIDAARALLDALEGVAGDNPYRVTIWATMVGRIAAIVGDSDWALRGAERGIVVDPGFSFVFLGTYQRLARCWALAMTGGAMAGATSAITEAQRIIAANLLDPPRSCVATWYALLGEMYLAAGSPDEAAAALDRAEFYVNAYGQRYPQGLILLLRARVLHARGKPAATVRAAAEAALTFSHNHEAYLFVHRAEQFLAELN